MKIVLYTSTSRNSVDDYNIFKLLEAYKSKHEFSIIEVRRDIKKTSPLRIWLSELKHGKNWLRRDTSKVFRKIKRLIDYSLFDNVIVRYSVREVNDQKSAEILRKLKPDLIFQCGAGILDSDIFSLSKLGAINVHHGFAPEVRGVSSILWSYYYSLKIGVTVHLIDENLDTGPVLMQYEHLTNESSYADLYYKCVIKGGDLLVQSIDKIPAANFEEEVITSYYFSSFSWRKYNDFRNSGFKPVKLPFDKRQKKIKKRWVSRL